MSSALAPTLRKREALFGEATARSAKRPSADEMSSLIPVEKYASSKAELLDVLKGRTATLKSGARSDRCGLVTSVACCRVFARLDTHHNPAPMASAAVAAKVIAIVLCNRTRF